MNIPVYDIEGKVIESEEIPEKFSIPPHYHSIFLSIRYIRNSLRRGTASTKKRGEVSGGGRKPWRQKGTGRARQGSIRSPLWKGGGVVFGPKPRSFRISIPKKVKKLGILSSISAKLNESKLYIVNGIKFEKPSTKDAVKLLNRLNLSGSTLFVFEDSNGEVLLSMRNIPKVTPMNYRFLNTYDILKHENLVLTKEAYEKVKEVWGNV
ncbi:MAG: 50S ribosomal protein L4 [Caldisericia bacterium]|nr:50S ribosomal protein L4 [Caldisericia bacterium]